MVNKLLALVYQAAPSFEVEPEEAARLFAAAGLMRCCALLRGIRLLEKAELGPVPGILERQHWETWLLSLHLLFRGEGALLELGADDIYWKRPLLKKFVPDRGYHEDWENRIAKLNYKKLADDLKALLVAAGESGNPDGSIGYDLTYKIQSTFSLHSNLSTLSPLM